MTVTTAGNWWFGTGVGLVFLAAASGVLTWELWGPSRERLALHLRAAAAFAALMLRRFPVRRTAARTPGRHAGTVIPVAVPAIFPGQDAALNAALTARAATLLEDTATDLPVITADTVTDLPAVTGGTVPGAVIQPSGHYEPSAAELLTAALKHDRHVFRRDWGDDDPYAPDVDPIRPYLRRHLAHAGEPCGCHGGEL